MIKKLLLMTLTLSVIVSCGKSTKENGNVTIDLWLTPQWKGVYSANEQGADYDSFFKKAVEDFRKENTNININIQVIPGEQRSDKLSVAIQTKTLPDIFFESSFAMTQYAHMGVLLPLDEIIDEASKKDISKSIWDNVTIGDKVYFYPFLNNPGTLVYNADMFKKAGLEKYIGGEYDIVTWTLEDYKTILETLKAKLPGIVPMGLFAKNNQGDTWNLAYLRMYGSPFFAPDGKLVVNDEKGVEALTFIDNLRKAGLTTTGAETLTSNDILALFQNEKLAICFVNSVLFNNILNDMESGKMGKFDARLANIPGIENPLSFTYVTGTAIFNTGNKEKMEAAKKFVQFFNTNAALVKASEYNGIPVRESAVVDAGNEFPYLKAYQNNAQYIFNFSNNTPGYAELRNILFPELQAVFTGAKTPKQALDTYVEFSNKIIEKEQAASLALKK